MSYVKELNEMTWSFSRIHSWEQCPYAFYLKYIEGREGESNYYAANGKAMHEVFEALLKGEVSLEDCTQLYADKYEEIMDFVGQSTMDSTFEKCMDYLCELESLNPKYEILAVEQELRFKIGRYKLLSFPDLVLRNKETGENILVDHKQATHFLKANGEPLKNQKDNFEAYQHQMYIYCKGVKECLGIDIDKIVWHHFKENGKLTIIPFKREEYDETMQWVTDTIAKIKKDKHFESVDSYMMCLMLCDYRNNCEYNEE